jgi:hypothetical protein
MTDATLLKMALMLVATLGIIAPVATATKPAIRRIQSNLDLMFLSRNGTM